MNKIGAALGSGSMIFVFIFIILIIGGGIVLGVLRFYGKEYDNRYAEAESLLLRVKECVRREGFLFSQEFDIFGFCAINKKVIEKEHLILIKEAAGEREIFWGVRSYDVQCQLKGENLPRCVEDGFVLGGKDYKIIVGTNQQRRNVLA